MKNKTITTIMCLSLIGAMSTPIFASDAKESQINTVSKSEEAIHQYPIEINGKTISVDASVMVPLRVVAENLGFDVTFENGSILVDNGTIHTVVTIGVDKYNITTSNKKLVGMSAPFSLGTAPYILDGVTYVPLELFDKLLGNQAGVVSLKDNKIVINYNSTQMANPFITCETLEEAKEIAGFSLTPPSNVSDGVGNIDIRVIKNTMIEVIFTGDENKINLRKAISVDDISGNYNTYDYVKIVNIKGADVTMKGKEGKISVAVWNNDGYAYAIQFENEMDIEKVSEMISTIK